MKKYELLYILRADLDEEAKKAAIENLANLIEKNGGKVVDTKEWGLRDFAYPIKKQKRGFYVLVKFEGTNDTLSEFSRTTKINPNVLRYLITKDDNQ